MVNFYIRLTYRNRDKTATKSYGVYYVERVRHREEDDTYIVDYTHVSDQAKAFDAKTTNEIYRQLNKCLPMYKVEMLPTGLADEVIADLIELGLLE